jgi:hypothetical protein
MNSPRQSLEPKLPGSAVFEPQGPLRWAEEHDVALGCECANPLLQIERWGQETQPKPELN